MPVNESDNLKMLLNLIKEVKPSLSDSAIKIDDSLVENLGLDSLDIMQLARKVRRNAGPDFDPQAWAANHQTHKYSVRSLLDAMIGAPAVEEKKGLPSGQQQKLAV
jgi:acyl carrier protein